MIADTHLCGLEVSRVVFNPMGHQHPVFHPTIIKSKSRVARLKISVFGLQTHARVVGFDMSCVAGDRSQGFAAHTGGLIEVPCLTCTVAGLQGVAGEFP